MAAQEPHAGEKTSASTSVQLANSDSEFKLIESKKTNSSTLGGHCIYTIDELNDRIADLTDFADKFENESDVSVHNELDSENCFVDICSSQFRNGMFEQMKEEARHGMKQCSVQSGNNKRTKKQLPKNTKKFNHNDADRNVGMKPMLVELHVFPGFDEKQSTPLPLSYDTLYIINIVMKAQTNLQNKPAYRKSLKEFLMSNQSQSIVQDSFWWFFCNKYQPTSEHQGSLFDRISKNYIHLLVAWTGLNYHDKVLKNYANLVSQAIYTTFCRVFPTSYQQFNDEFRDEIVALMTLWFMGSRPAPRSWVNWNFCILEPTGLRKGEKLKDDVIKAKSLETELKKLEETNLVRRISADLAISKNISAEQTLGSVPKVSSSKQMDNVSGQPIDNIDKTAEEDEASLSESKNNIVKHISSVIGMDNSKHEKKSCAAGESAVFTRVVFDVYGRSPLVEHFLQTQNLCKNAGTSVLVQRTEIRSLPSLCALTYEDIVTNTKRTSKEARENYERITDKITQEKQRCLKKQRTDDMKFKRCSCKLLSNPREVRKISELLRSPDGKEEPEDTDVRTAKLRSLLAKALNE